MKQSAQMTAGNLLVLLVFISSSRSLPAASLASAASSSTGQMADRATEETLRNPEKILAERSGERGGASVQQLPADAAGLSSITARKQKLLRTRSHCNVTSL